MKLISPQLRRSDVKCSCGNTFTTQSTKSAMTVELCNECTRLTGKQKLVDTGGASSASSVVRTKDKARAPKA